MGSVVCCQAHRGSAVLCRLRPYVSPQSDCSRLCYWPRINEHVDIVMLTHIEFLCTKNRQVLGFCAVNASAPTPTLHLGPNDCGKSTLLRAINNEQAGLATEVLYHHKL